MSNDLVIFNPTAVTEFGNKFVAAMLQHELRKEAAEAELQAASEREGFFDFELTRAAMFLHNDENAGVNVYDVFGDKADVEKLNRSVLLALGVIERTITDDDKVVYDFTDPAIRGSYSFGADVEKTLVKQHQKEGKSEEEAKALVKGEIKQRRSRRNALNIRLKRCIKAAVALLDAKATPDDLQYTQTTAGELVPVIAKGPKEVMGNSKKPVVIHSKNAAKMEGASAVPSMSGIASVAETKHTKKPSSKDETETSNRNEGKSEEDFLALVNATGQAIKNREGNFSDAEKTALANLATFLSESGVKVRG